MYFLNFVAAGNYYENCIMVTLFSDIVMAISRARHRNAVVQRFAKAPRDVQNAARAAEKSVTTVTK